MRSKLNALHDLPSIYGNILARILLSVCDFLLVNNFTSCLALLMQMIGHILAVDKRCLSLTYLFGINPKLRTTNFDVENLETSFYHMLSKKLIRR